MELWERLKYLTVKDVFWCGLLKFDVPYKRNTIRFMRSIFIIVIGGNQQLGILRGEKKKNFYYQDFEFGNTPWRNRRKCSVAVESETHQDASLT